MPPELHRPLRALIVEDSDDDLLLTLNALRRGGFELEYRQVMTAADLDAALRAQAWDVVICDHNLPSFDSERALAQVKALEPELPFVIVSGDFSDQATVKALAAGASDVVAKDKLERLVPVLQRELRQLQLRNELRMSQQSLERLAYYDPLTGLPNEQRFLRELDYCCARGEPFGLVVLEVRRLTQIVRSLGQYAGHRFAAELASILREGVGGARCLAQVGRDRFGVIASSVSTRGHLEDWVRTLKANLPAAIELDGVPVPLIWSVGGSLYPMHGATTSPLYRNAELALALAQQSPSGVALFDRSGQDGTEPPEDLEQALRLALQREEFFLCYQPQFDLRSGRCTGAEALLRWRDPLRGVVAPREFVPTLEESGLIIPVGEWVLRTACRQAAAWRRQGIADMRVAVNLSMVQFEQNSLRRVVESAVREYELPPSALELEITESIAMNDREQVVATLDELRDLGVSLAIDDFGTGYSSLNYLKHFPVDKLKIDQSFVRGMDQDPRDRAIVSAIIAMARALGLGLVAEGVESAMHLSFLREQNCEQGQGYYLGRPVTPERFEDPRLFAAATF